MSQTTPSAEDRFLISDLWAKYAWALDTCDTDGFVECFAEDAVFDELTVVTGRDQIRQLVLRYFHENPLFAGRQHLIGQSLFEPDDEGRPDHWKVKSFAHVFVLRDVGPSLYWTGYYTDVVAKIDGEWLFVYRRASKWLGDVLNAFPDNAIARQTLPANFGAPIA
ncbi:nuclear transport factor 2 family protein [Subtercola sp. YIM 133946]|uniref:nuclear transport factor 2 family protein n=1 Tax=Subtercola sp. YIM 133946 TaxID=3118909 RepID=UPI002F95A163